MGKKDGARFLRFSRLFRFRENFPNLPNRAKKTRKKCTPRRLNISRIGGGIKSSPGGGRFGPVFGRAKKTRKKGRLFSGFNRAKVRGLWKKDGARFLKFSRFFRVALCPPIGENFPMCQIVRKKREKVPPLAALTSPGLGGG